jgi:two-component system NarL family sensor kinase
VTEERNRLAREIHDTLAQGLTAIILQLEIADMSEPSDAARKPIAKALDLARANLLEARRSVLDLRAEALEGRSLPEALDALIASFRRETGTDAEFVGPPTVERYPARVESGLYRIAQEALTNVRKHAAASHVRVELLTHEDHLHLAIVDNGRGFNPKKTRSAETTDGFGLRGMNERAALLGGTLSMESRRGRGTRLEVQVPMAGLGLRLRR